MPCAEREFNLNNLLGDQEPMWYSHKASKLVNIIQSYWGWFDSILKTYFADLICRFYVSSESIVVFCTK